jgi:hypothetical protein
MMCERSPIYPTPFLNWKIMTRITEERFVQCPYHFARAYLEETLQPLATSRAHRTILLSVAAGDHTLAKEVNVEFTVALDPRHFDEPWAVHWEPKGGGPYPVFDGTLTVRADETYANSFLELAGQYTPPLGAPGTIFDAVVGKRIAELTAQNLLQRMGQALESRYQAEEKQKNP